MNRWGARGLVDWKSMKNGILDFLQTIHQPKLHLLLALMMV